MGKINNKRVEELAERISAQLEDGFVAKPIEVIKINDAKMHGFTIVDTNTSSGVNPTIYYENDMSDDDIVSHVLAVFDKHKTNPPAFSVEEICNRDNVLQKVYPTLVNIDKNAQWLEDKVWRKFLDLAVVYRFNVTNSNDADTLGSIAIHNGMAEKLNLTEQELYDAAISNISQDIKSFGMSVFIAKHMAGVDIPDNNDDPLRVISNNDAFYGANVILLDEALDILKERLGNTFFLIPSSIHEWIAVAPDNVALCELREMVAEVNRNVVSPQEFLSNNVYLYQNGKMEVANI